MAKIDSYPGATPLTGLEEFAVMQGSVTKSVTAAQIAALSGPGGGGFIPGGTGSQLLSGDGGTVAIGAGLVLLGGTLSSTGGGTGVGGVPADAMLDDLGTDITHAMQDDHGVILEAVAIPSIPVQRPPLGSDYVAVTRPTADPTKSTFVRISVNDLVAALAAALSRP